MRSHGPENIVNTVVVFFLAVATLCPFSVSDVHAQGEIFLQLDDEGFDMTLDAMRQQLYVSVPSQNEVVVISSVSGLITNRIRTDTTAIREALGVGTNVLVGTMPHGIDISLDSSTLFVALNGASSVIYVNLDTLAQEQVIIGTELGDARTWDVIEGTPNRIFASANPGSSGFAYIVMIKRDRRTQRPGLRTKPSSGPDRFLRAVRSGIRCMSDRAFLRTPSTSST